MKDERKLSQSRRVNDAFKNCRTNWVQWKRNYYNRTVAHDCNYCKKKDVLIRAVTTRWPATRHWRLLYWMRNSYSREYHFVSFISRHRQLKYIISTLKCTCETKSNELLHCVSVELHSYSLRNKTQITHRIDFWYHPGDWNEKSNGALNWVIPLS